MKTPMTRDAAPQGEYGQHVVAVAIGDKDDGDKSKCLFKSAYEGKEGQGMTAPAVSAQPSRILVISSPQFLDNPFARQGNAPPMPPQMQMMGGMGGDEDLQMHLAVLRAAVPDRDDPRVQEHPRLDGGRHRSHRGEREAPRRTRTSRTRTSRSPTRRRRDPDAAKKQAEEYEGEITKVQQRVQWTLILFPAALFAAFGIVTVADARERPRQHPTGLMRRAAPAASRGL